jgi:hypothetical protein
MSKARPYELSTLTPPSSLQKVFSHVNDPAKHTAQPVGVRRKHHGPCSSGHLVASRAGHQAAKRGHAP